MNKEDKVKIQSRLRQELSTSFEIGGEKYLVMTEDAKPRIITQVYHGGKVVKSAKTDYTAIIDTKNLAGKISNMMKKQHDKAIQAFKGGLLKELGVQAGAKAEKSAEAKRAAEAKKKAEAQAEERRMELKASPKPLAPKANPPWEYLNDVKSLFARKHYKAAMALLEEALGKHPGDAFLQSYSGCLNAVVNKKYAEGIKTCQTALENLKKKLPFGQEFYLPALYLNLGRAYLAAEDKVAAINAFKEGLKLEPENNDLLWEMKKLGDRKPLPISFLERSNPLNIYIGKMLHKMRK